MLSLEKVVNFLSQNNKRGEHWQNIAMLIHTNVLRKTQKCEALTLSNAAKHMHMFNPSLVNALLTQILVHVHVFLSDTVCKLFKEFGINERILERIVYHFFRNDVSSPTLGF